MQDIFFKAKRVVNVPVAQELAEKAIRSTAQNIFGDDVIQAVEKPKN